MMITNKQNDTANSVFSGNNICYLDHIPVTFPEKMVLARLGFSRRKNKMSTEQYAQLRYNILEAFRLCHPQGAWTCIEIKRRTAAQTVLADGTVFKSRSLSEMLAESDAVLLMAATVGSQIMAAIRDVVKSDGARALILDAVGGQTANAALDLLNRHLRQRFIRKNEILTSMRFSPGYADLELENQKFIFEILKLEKLGLELTDRFLLVPEKSVIGICGVKKRT